MIGLWLFCFVLVGLAFLDHKLKKVPDILLSFLLIICAVAWVNDFEYGYFYFGLFAILYFVNSVFVGCSGKPLMAWADILVFPAVESMMRYFDLFYPLLYISLAVAFAVSIRRKESVAGIPYFAAAFFLALIFSYLVH